MWQWTWKLEIQHLILKNAKKNTKDKKRKTVADKNLRTVDILFQRNIPNDNVTQQLRQ